MFAFSLPVQGLSRNLESDAFAPRTVSLFSRLLETPLPAPGFAVVGADEAGQGESLRSRLFSCMLLPVTWRIGGVIHLRKLGEMRMWLGQKPVIE